VSWAADALLYTDQYPPGFDAKGALVLEFTTPAVPSPAPSSQFGSIQTVQDPGSIAPRNGALSASPCDFTAGITGQPGISTVFANDDGPDVPFTLGYEKVGPRGGDQLYVQLQPNTTYYLNMYNPLGCGAGKATCDVRVQFSKQPGT
jgi:hypothetical protein